MTAHPYELIIDLFAGGGGASLGIEMALGRSPDIAVNHDPVAIAMHQINHPNTLHYCKNVWQVDPVEAVRNRRVGLLWASPDCKHFSKAKGGKPVKRHIRDLAWVVVRWAKQARPRVILLENVEEFRDWGPLAYKLDTTGEKILDANGEPTFVPDPARKGQTYKQWVGELRRLGYKVEWRELRACDYGAPTIRKRFFMVARCDGKPIVWPEPTHGDPKSEAVKSGKLKPWRTAAEIIDWSLPCYSIFLTKEEGKAVGVKRPLVEATMARLGKGVWRYVINAAEPFIINLTHQGGDRNEPVGEPARTVTSANRGEKALVVPHVMTMRNAQKPHNEANKPTHTIMADGAHLNLVEAAIAPVIAGVGGRAGQSRPRAGDEPMHTGTSKADSVVVAPLITKFHGENAGAPVTDPAPTATANSYIKRPGGAPPLGVVQAFLAQHNNHSGVDGNAGREATDPLSTIMQSASHQGVVEVEAIAPHILNLKGSDRRMSSAKAPAPGVTAQGWHIAEVRAFLIKYYGQGVGQKAGEPLHTIPTKERFGLITLRGVLFQIVDIGMRMLRAHELFGAQGFPGTYIIDRGLFFNEATRGFEERPITSTDQVAKCGNSVCPPVACALALANVPEMAIAREAAE